MKDKPSNGLDFPTVLFLIFLVLKLTGYIKWSWWWVTSPLWFGVTFLSIIYLIIKIKK